jgi:hypothetical protein
MKPFTPLEAKIMLPCSIFYAETRAHNAVQEAVRGLGCFMPPKGYRTGVPTLLLTGL